MAIADGLGCGEPFEDVSLVDQVGGHLVLTADHGRVSVDQVVGGPVSLGAGADQHAGIVVEVEHAPSVMTPGTLVSNNAL